MKRYSCHDELERAVRKVDKRVISSLESAATVNRSAHILKSRLLHTHTPSTDLRVKISHNISMPMMPTHHHGHKYLGYPKPSPKRIPFCRAFLLEFENDDDHTPCNMSLYIYIYI